MATSSHHVGPPHPRRPTAQRSVCLRHNTTSTSPKNSTSTEYDNSSASPSSIIPLVSRNSSDESSNVDKWFDRSNNNADGDKVVDNDPPFFLQQSSSEESPDHDPTAATFSKVAQRQPLPMHATLKRVDSDGSGSSDFRAVIDDLTVQNKKLRRRLKKYEKLQDAHLNNEKLFEVRVHGLSSTKRAELENLLRKFAITAAAPANATASAEGSVPMLKTQESTSASSNFADSAYVSATGPDSASASGQGSSGAVSNSMSGQTRPPFRKSVRSSNNNIHSYLHDIPEGLLPHHPAVMTEKTKQNIVIRRLEQIFAGTGAVQGDHHHPIQQQEVSQLAAKADRNALQATGQNPASEGNREAPIMPVEREELNREVSSEDTTPESAQGIAPSHKIAGHDFASSSPDQRPTRPLDLDPHRAQNPYENIEYIRHLGFSPPHVQTMETPEDGHGWIYLNFLTNLAQLHTINVTVDFVKKTLSERDSKLELSEDGRKVRWKGGRDMTSTASEIDEGSPYIARSPLGKSPLKRSRSSHHAGMDQSQHSKKRMLEKQNSKFVYTPLFYHCDSDEDSDVSSSSSEAESESQFLHVPEGQSSAMTSSGVRALSAKRNKKTDNGPIIFYSNAKFCTDLSGDPKTQVSMTYNPIMYRVASNQALGAANAPVPKQQNVLDTRGPLESIKEFPEAMDLDDSPLSEVKELRFPRHTPLSQSSGGFVKSPIELQASGVGGVSPADNFAINVRTTLIRADDLDSAPNYRKQYSSKLANVLQKSDPHHGSKLVLKEDLVQTSCQRLPPSELPPASCWIGQEDFDDDRSEAESYQSFSHYMDYSGDVPSTAPQTIDVPYLGSDESDADEMSDSEEDDDDDNQSDGSVDLLATARELDPDTVRAREREYDAHMAERLAEEIPAGSSAATAGGGSGFASPASGVDIDEYRKARIEDAKRKAQASSSTTASAPSFQRTKTSESMAVNGQSP